ncbi:sensor histidine kinase [Confluentibacter citreus]|uniref:sensor histidine kinase n=1 Tax=Confluentibacter citreus TaxID=2007307 RepID=UPI000C284827|nr:ATP-binding protein [Confluentibacter citreus]
MKTQTKIILFLSSIFLLFTLIFSGFIYYSIANFSYDDFFKRLEIRAITSATILLESGNDTRTIKEIRQDYLEELPNEKITIIDLASKTSESDLKKLELPNDFIQKGKEEKRAFYKKDNTFYSLVYYTSSENKDYLVFASAENYYSTHHMAYLENSLITAIIFSVVIIFLISYFFSRVVVKPLRSIIKKMNTISTKNLNLRLDIPKKNAELRLLSLTFNNMLNRLEASFETQNNFISNASHELNTPLTNIIGEAEVTLTKERSTEDYEAALTNILEEAEKLSKKTQALLYLAQTGFNGKVQKNKLLRVDQVLMDAVQTVEKIYSNTKVHIDFSLLPETSDKLKIMGNSQLLELAISNLLINACKYSDKKDVYVALAVSDTNAIIIIKDHGIGIPKKDMPYIYDPFFRASNVGVHEGYGIGLPLTRNLIKMHDGELIVSSEENVETMVEIKLPLFKFS